MQTVEFQTTVVNGIIEIPDELKGKVAGTVNVRVMPEENFDNTDTRNNEPLKTPPREIDWASAERGRQMLLRASMNQERIAAGWAAAMREMGIPRLEPVSAEKLQEMMIAEGIDPESNEFSRGIIEMREE